MPRQEDRKDRPAARFHGRVEANGRVCAEPGCAEPGEFRAPPLEGASGGDRPRDFRWLCLDHVRAFNGRYNYFDGMTADEIHAAQRPLAGWERETRAFAHAGTDAGPRWADFADPLEAIGARFPRPAADRTDGRPLSGDERRALSVLGLGVDADLKAVRRRYSDLVRRFHPDRNGGDRSHERQLGEVIGAWQVLRRSTAFLAATP